MCELVGLLGVGGVGGVGGAWVWGGGGLPLDGLTVVCGVLLVWRSIWSASSAH